MISAVEEAFKALAKVMLHRLVPFTVGCAAWWMPSKDLLDYPVMKKIAPMQANNKQAKTLVVPSNEPTFTYLPTMICFA